MQAIASVASAPGTLFDQPCDRQHADIGFLFDDSFTWPKNCPQCAEEIACGRDEDMCRNGFEADWAGRHTKLDIGAYSKDLERCKEQNDIETAEAILDNMAKYGIDADQYVCMVMITIYEKASMHRKSKRVHDWMIMYNMVPSYMVREALRGRRRLR